MQNQISSHTLNTVNVVLITDNNFVIPTATAMYSIIKNKLENTKVLFHIVFSDPDESKASAFFHMGMSRKDVEINIIPVSAAKYSNHHVFNEDSVCVASIAALLKFDIPNLLPDLDKILYLDGDIIARGDLHELYSTDIKDCYAAVVIDSGSIYWKHEHVKKVSHYFNSGVMLLNLSELRKNHVPLLLYETKKGSADSFLMDQNVFNIIFDGKIRLLPMRYNCLYVNLIRAKSKYSISDLNKTYDTNYFSLDDAMNDAVIIHYSSADKPWKNLDTPLGYLWKKYCSDAIYEFPSLCDIQTSTGNGEGTCPTVSVIIPVYNTEQYLEDSLNSILEQTLSDIEILCVDDGSTDGSLSILKKAAEQDPRVRILSQISCGQSAARNLGLKFSKGEYVYFFDSDDLLSKNALEELYKQAKKDDLECLLFDGDSFFESEHLEKEFSYYKTAYSRSATYPGVQDGPDMFLKLQYNGEYTVQPCLYLFKRKYLEDNNIKFLNGVIYEDNLFSLQVHLQCQRAGHNPSIFFHRRVREGSTITSEKSLFHFYSHFKCLLSMWLYIMNGMFSSEINRVAKNMLFYFKKITFSYLSSLPSNERNTLCYENKTEQILGDIIFEEFMSKINTEHSLEKTEHSPEKLQNNFKRSRSIGMSKVKELLKRILPMPVASMRRAIRKLHAAINKSAASNKAQLGELSNQIDAIKTQLTNILKFANNNNSLLEQTLSSARKVESHAAEAIWASIFHDTICESKWLYDKTFSPGRWAIGYPFLYALYRILNEMRPSHILELGLGQSTKMISQYSEMFGRKHFVIEKDCEWIKFFKNDFDLSSKTDIIQLDYEMVPYKDAGEVRVFKDFAETLSEYGKYDFIMIDAPFGGDMKYYSRIDALGILPQCLSDTFVIMIDDVERPGEQNTIKEILSTLSDNNREYAVGYYGGDKRCIVIASANMKFLCSL